MFKFNCFYFVVFSLLFITQQIAAFDLARLYGHEGHKLQKRSGNYPQSLFHFKYRHDIMLFNARKLFSTPYNIFIIIVYHLHRSLVVIIKIYIEKEIEKKKWHTRGMLKQKIIP